MTEHEFFNPYTHGFARVAVAVPRNRVADPVFNAARNARAVPRGRGRRRRAGRLPGAGPVGLHLRRPVPPARAARCLRARAAGRWPRAVARHRRGRRGRPAGGVDHRLYNCAAVVARGPAAGRGAEDLPAELRRVLRGRQFNARRHRAADARSCSAGQRVPFGTDLLFQSRQIAALQLHVEICEDLWVPIPPSSYAALAGATVLVNLSASNVTIGKAATGTSWSSLQSARCLAAYLYTAAGIGESTTDLAWDGHALIYESGTCWPRASASATARTSSRPTSTSSASRASACGRTPSAPSVRSTRARWRAGAPSSSNCRVPSQLPHGLLRKVERFPYVPVGPGARATRAAARSSASRCRRWRSACRRPARKLVIGVSGGLDSTQALLVCAQAMDRLGLPRTNILAYTMPGFATSGRTLAQAHRLMARSAAPRARSTSAPAACRC